MLGTKLVALEKKKGEYIYIGKNTKKRKKKKTHLTVQISSTSRSHCIYGPIKLKFGGYV